MHATLNVVLKYACKYLYIHCIIMLIILNDNFLKIKAKKWGNSLGIRLPKAFTEELGISDESELNLAVNKNRLILTKEKDYDLESLLKLVTKENLHKETQTGAVTGKEVW